MDPLLKDSITLATKALITLPVAVALDLTRKIAPNNKLGRRLRDRYRRRTLAPLWELRTRVLENSKDRIQSALDD